MPPLDDSDAVDDKPLASISALRSRFEGLQADAARPRAANRVEEASRGPAGRAGRAGQDGYASSVGTDAVKLLERSDKQADSGISATIEKPAESQASSSLKPPRPPVPSRAASFQKPSTADTATATTPDNITAPLSTPDSSLGKKGPPPPRPTGKKPPPVLRDRRRSSDGVEAARETEPAQGALNAPNSAGWTTQEHQEAPAAPASLSGVAALRARFDSAQSAGSPVATASRSAGDALVPSSSAPSTSQPPSRWTTPRPSRPASPQRGAAGEPTPAVIVEHGDTEMIQSRVALRPVNSVGTGELRDGRLTPCEGARSRAGSTASNRSVSIDTPAAEAIPGLRDEVDAAVASGRLDNGVTGKSTPAIPSRNKPVIPPRAAPGAGSTPVSRTSADSILSEGSTDSPAELLSAGSTITSEPESASRSGSRRPSAARELAPPPIPANRPSPASPRAGADKSGNLPPKLPVRQRTMPPAVNGGDTPVPPAGSAPLAPPPMPMRNRAATTAAAMLPSSSSSGSLSNAAVLPPPPSRNVTPRINRVAAAPRDVSSDDEDVVADDTEQPSSTATAAPMTTALRRALDEYPDTTRAYRRPPEFVPRQMISTPTTHAHCFAVFGSTLCIGSHHVKVFDLTLGDTKPVLTVELRSTGLDFRGKDPKITSMCFRAPLPGHEEGRYVWCGTSHGHLWEFDVLTGSITDTKAGAHGSAITHIFRYRRWMMTLDEGGKVHVFGPDPSAAEGDAASIASSPVRTIRTSDKNNFAAMLGNQLWTSSGPLTRSTTNASLRGPTIRVFEPTSANNTVGQTTFTSEWTGAVTSAAIIPFKPGEIYLGHEGGFVSIFSQADLSCLRVLKIWPSDILSIEGVGDRLWVGGRGGNISVYDVTSQPWVATNIWNAHDDHSVHKIYADPASVAHSGRYVVWTWARDALHAWNGLLAVDWIESTLLKREREYCNYRDLRVLICSWNIGSCKPTDLGGSVIENSNFLAECLQSVESPDIVAFGLQEVIDLDDKKLTAKTMLFGGKMKLDGSKSTGDKISSAYRHWQDKLISAVRLAMPPTCPYVMVHTENLVGLLSVVFVKSELKPMLRDGSLTTIKRGLNGIYGNKGAIITRMVIDDSSLCLINVHLAAGQTQKQARNADLAAILDDKAVLPYTSGATAAYVNGGDGSAVLDHEIVFLSGDLNYRIDLRRDNVISTVHAGDLGYLLEHDQLRKEMRNNSSFRLKSFIEPPIAFAPTYKYTPGTQEYDMSEKKRIPAWCDRVLYRSMDPARIECLNYKRYEPTVSDHRPISASFRVKVKSIDPDLHLKTRQAVEKEWFKREAECFKKLEEALWPL